MFYIYIALSSYRTTAFKLYMLLCPTDCYSHGDYTGKLLYRICLACTALNRLVGMRVPAAILQTKDENLAKFRL